MKKVERSSEALKKACRGVQGLTSGGFWALKTLADIPSVDDDSLVETQFYSHRA